MKHTGSFESRKLTDVVIYFEYSHDPGVRTFSNGDPGYPPDTNWEVTKIERGGFEVTLTDEDEATAEIELEEFINDNEHTFGEYPNDMDY